MKTTDLPDRIEVTGSDWSQPAFVMTEEIWQARGAKNVFISLSETPHFVAHPQGGIALWRREGLRVPACMWVRYRAIKNKDGVLVRMPIDLPGANIDSLYESRKAGYVWPDPVPVDEG